MLELRGVALYLIMLEFYTSLLCYVNFDVNGRLEPGMVRTENGEGPGTALGTLSARPRTARGREQR